jgi:glycosyltransferase involved in cell wall biosynthesis
MAELVADGRTGLHFEPRNPADLAAKVRALLGDSRRLATMRVAARREFEAHYTAEANYRHLLRVYSQALVNCGKASEPLDPGPANYLGQETVAVTP